MAHYNEASEGWIDKFDKEGSGHTTRVTITHTLRVPRDAKKCNRYYLCVEGSDYAGRKWRASLGHASDNKVGSAQLARNQSRVCAVADVVMTRFAHSSNNNTVRPTHDLPWRNSRIYIRVAACFVARPPLKTAMTAGACARICINEHTRTSVFHRANQNHDRSTLPAARDISLRCVDMRFARVSNTRSRADIGKNSGIVAI